MVKTAPTGQKPVNVHQCYRKLLKDGRDSVHHGGRDICIASDLLLKILYIPIHI